MIRLGTKYNPKTKIWSGPEIQQIYHPDVSVGQVLLTAISHIPNKVVQICNSNGSRLTNNDLRLRSIRIAKRLVSMNYEQGDVIGLVARNTENLSGVVFAALLCGYPINALDPSFGNDEILHMFGCTRPKLVFCDVSAYQNVKECINVLKLDSPIFTINGKIEGVGCVEEFLLPTGDEDEFIPPKLKRGGKEIAVMVCTSGTTGVSKAVCLSHEMILSQFSNLFCGNYDDVVFVTSPLFWMTGWMCLLHCTVVGATRIITDETFTPKLLIKIVEKYKVTILLTAPTFMMLTVQYPDIEHSDLSSVKIYLCAGSPIPESQIQKMNSYLKNGCIVEGYGMSEIGAYAVLQNPSDIKRGSAGQLASNIKMKIINDNGQNLGINEHGEVVFRTPILFSGYYRNPEASKLALDDEGWVYSGDIGYFDNDGDLFLVDRKKDIIKYKNYQVSPTELESVLLTLPGVLQACVCAVPDLLAIGLPAAAIIRSEDVALTEEEVCNFIANQMSAHKHLQGGVYFVKSLPLTASGKIQRRKVRDILIKLYEEKNKK